MKMQGIDHFVDELRRLRGAIMVAGAGWAPGVVEPEEVETVAVIPGSETDILPKSV